MRSSRHFLVASMVGLTLIALTTPAAHGAGVQAPASDGRAPSAIELALAEYSCGPQMPATSADERYQCISDRVDSLRADFGYDLSRLTASRRKAIDKACGRLRGALAREAYVACVSGELVSLRSKKAAPESAAAPDAAAAAPDAVVPPVDSPPPPPSSAWMVWLIGFLGAGVVAAGGAVVAMRVKAARHRCRNCGTKVPPTGDLCPDCRKQAAEALRQAAAERAERDRAQEEEKRRQEQEAEQRARDEAEARLRREDEERRRLEREEEDARLREEETRRNVAERQRQHDPAAGGDVVFDPYAILGVSRDAGQDAVVAAYEEARSKYDLTAVSHLGDDVQQHFKAKAEAVERAYQMLAG